MRTMTDTPAASTGSWAGVPAALPSPTFQQELFYSGTGPNDSVIGVSVLGPGASTDTLVHEQEEFVFVIKGDIIAELDGGSSLMATNSYVMMPPGTRHRYHNSSDKPTAMLFVFPRGRADTC